MKIKGVAIRGTTRAIESLHGRAALERVRATLPTRIREQLDQVLPVEWYPVEISAAIHLAVREVLGGGSWTVNHDLGKEAARLDFTGIYKAMIRAVQYDTVWDRMERAWTQYASAGDVKWFDRKPGTSRAYITGVAGYNEGMWNSIAGRCEGMLILSGAKGASVTMVEPGSTQCRFEALWLT